MVVQGEGAAVDDPMVSPSPPRIAYGGCMSLLIPFVPTAAHPRPPCTRSRFAGGRRRFAGGDSGSWTGKRNGERACGPSPLNPPSRPPHRLHLASSCFQHISPIPFHAPTPIEWVVTVWMTFRNPLECVIHVHVTFSRFLSVLKTHTLSHTLHKTPSGCACQAAHCSSSLTHGWNVTLG